MERTEQTQGEKYNNSHLKRSVDILVGLAGLPIAVVAIGLVGLAIKLDDGGEVLFRQERVGKGGKTFTMYKLRTYNSEGEITSVGKKIRPLAIDELPQMLNILKGEMSAFGIRAIRAVDFEIIYNLYKSDPNLFDEEFYRLWKSKYYLARPGGFPLAVARVESFFARTFETSAEVKQKMAYDIEQADHESLAMDLTILFTVLSKIIQTKANSKTYAPAQSQD